MLDMFSTGKEIREANPETVILPIGSTEQHGPHLPVATDTLIADGEVRRSRIGGASAASQSAELFSCHMTLKANPVTFLRPLYGRGGPGKAGRCS